MDEHQGTSSGGRKPSQNMDLARCSKPNSGSHADNAAGTVNNPATIKAVRTDTNVLGRDCSCLRSVLCPITAIRGAPFERVSEAITKKGIVARGPDRACIQRVPNAMAANRDSVYLTRHVSCNHLPCCNSLTLRTWRYLQDLYKRISPTNTHAIHCAALGVTIYQLR